VGVRIPRRVRSTWCRSSAGQSTGPSSRGSRVRVPSAPHGGFAIGTARGLLTRRGRELAWAFDSPTLRSTPSRPEWYGYRSDEADAGGSTPPGGTHAHMVQRTRRRPTEPEIGVRLPVWVRIGTWRSLVALAAGGRAVVGSNPAVPTRRVVAQLGQRAAFGTRRPPVRIRPTRLRRSQPTDGAGRGLENRRG
jgi:hypothetical protein